MEEVLEDEDIQGMESDEEVLMDDLEMTEADGSYAVTSDAVDFVTDSEYVEDEGVGEELEKLADEAAGDVSAPATADIVRDIEAILFIAPDPVSLEVLAEVTSTEGEDLAHAVEAVRDKYSDPDGGIVFAEIAGGYTFRTGDFAREAVERFCRRPIDYSLSPAAMETLAIFAYLQPITRPEIARIRGVGADTVVANLLDKGLVAEAGRAQQTGAVKYRTTESFEKLFGIADLADLPSLEGFEATPADVEELREKLHLAADKRQ